MTEQDQTNSPVQMEFKASGVGSFTPPPASADDEKEEN